MQAGDVDVDEDETDGSCLIGQVLVRPFFKQNITKKRCC